MGINKVQYGNTTLIDLTADTVTADKLMQGYTAHDRTGAVITGTATGGSGSGAVWQDAQGYVHLSDEGDIELQTKTVTPSTSAQTVMADAGYYALEKVNVNAMPTGTAGTPTATKGTVSNHAVSITPSVTNTTGYITGGTKTGTAVSVSASELVSGTYSVTSSGTKDVTNYASASVPSGTEGTPTASKGTVSNHSVSVTPSVTNSGGYITGSTKTGTAVTVSASELVSGTKSISANGTGIDVTNYASVDVSVPSVSPTLITKNITANGTYNASSDNADGYSSVTVDVSGGGGGASNVVRGTFTTNSTAGSTQTIAIPYTGNGYPIQCTIEVVGGFYNSNNTDWYNTLHRYAIGWWCMSKQYPATTPIYGADWSNNSNMGTVMAYYKNSTSSLTSYAAGGGLGNASYYSDAGTPAYPDESRAQCVVFNSNTQMSFYISNTSYGLLADTEYEYTIIYSE